MKINGKLVNIKQPDYQMSLDELSAKVEARLPKFLQKDQIYVPSDVENEIGSRGNISPQRGKWRVQGVDPIEHSCLAGIGFRQEPLESILQPKIVQAPSQGRVVCRRPHLQRHGQS